MAEIGGTVENPDIRQVIRPRFIPPSGRKPEKDKQQKLQSPFSFRRQTTVQREAAAYDDK